MIETQFQPLEFVHEIWKLTKEIFTESQIKEILLHIDDRVRNVLYSALDNETDPRPFKFVLEKLREVPYEHIKVPRYLLLGQTKFSTKINSKCF
jgi:hypothetical protein